MAEQYLATIAVLLAAVFFTVLVILFRSRRELSKVRRMIARDRKHVSMNDAAIKALFPAARLHVVQDADHWLHAEKPRAFNAVVSRFVERFYPA